MNIKITNYKGKDFEKYKDQEYIFSELDRLGFDYEVQE